MNAGELKGALRRLIERSGAQLGAGPIKARVIRQTCDAEAYTVDVQPLLPDGSDDPDHRPIPEVEVDRLLGGAAGLYVKLPKGSVVRVGFYDNDPAQPYVDGVLALAGTELQGADAVLIGERLVLSVPTILLGGHEAAQPAVLGHVLETWLNAHVHMSPVGQTSPPLTPLVGEELSLTTRIK